MFGGTRRYLIYSYCFDQAINGSFWRENSYEGGLMSLYQSRHHQDGRYQDNCKMSHFPIKTQSCSTLWNQVHKSINHLKKRKEDANSLKQDGKIINEQTQAGIVTTVTEMEYVQKISYLSHSAFIRH